MRHIWSVEISLENGKLVITLAPKSKLTLKQLLVRINDENLHHEVDTGQTTGKKRGKSLSLYSSPEAFRSGMQGIAPQGMTVKEGCVSAYRQGVDGKAEVMVERYRRAMFE